MHDDDGYVGTLATLRRRLWRGPLVQDVWICHKQQQSSEVACTSPYQSRSAKQGRNAAGDVHDKLYTAEPTDDCGVGGCGLSSRSDDGRARHAVHHVRERPKAAPALCALLPPLLPASRKYKQAFYGIQAAVTNDLTSLQKRRLRAERSALPASSHLTLTLPLAAYPVRRRGAFFRLCHIQGSATREAPADLERRILVSHWSRPLLLVPALVSYAFAFSSFATSRDAAIPVATRLRYLQTNDDAMMASAMSASRMEMRRAVRC